MKTLTTAGRWTRWIAGTVAVLASLFTVGGPLMLAEHYASSGAGGGASGYYYAAERSRVCACQDIPNADSVSVPPGARNS